MATKAAGKLRGMDDTGLIATREEAVALALEVIKAYDAETAQPRIAWLQRVLGQHKRTHELHEAALQGLKGRIEQLEEPWYKRRSTWVLVAGFLVLLLTGCVKASPVDLEACTYEATIEATFTGQALTLPDTVVSLGCPNEEG